MDMSLMRIVTGKFRGDERGIIIKNSSAKKLSGGVVKDGKQDQDATTHMNIIIPNSEQVIEENEENLPKCVKKTLYENGPEVEHTKNSIPVKEGRQDSIQPPRSMQVNIIIPNSDCKSSKCEVVKGRDLIFAEECEECTAKKPEESPFQSASERKYVRKYVCNSKHIRYICHFTSCFSIFAFIFIPLECCDYYLASLDA